MKAKTIKHFVAASSLLGLLAALLFVPKVGAQQFSEWSTPVNLGAVVNSTANDQHPALSKDGLSLYFSSNRSPGGCGGLDIWVSQRASVDSPWEAPFNLGCTLNSSANDLAPTFSTDGHLLFFHSFRAGGCGGGDLYYSHRKNRRDDQGWEAPRNLNRFGLDPDAGLICGSIGSVSFVNTPNTDAGPNYFQDEDGTTVLYFTRSDQADMAGDFDIYTTTLGGDGTWGAVARNNELSTTPFRDTRTAIRRRGGLEMILSSERPGGLGDPPRDLWVSTRASTQDPWSIPVLLPNVNTAALEGAPALSWDGTELYFFSARTDLGGFGGNDLYRSTRTKLTGPQ
jgi:hypothetical protein